MADRKPREVTFESWVDRQIRRAQEAGEFDDLPGYGKPIPRGGDGEDWWLRSYLEREGLSAEELLPESLHLRKAIERLPAEVDNAADEAEVRALVRAIDLRIAAHIRDPQGPPVPIRLVDQDALLERWRAAHSRPDLTDVEQPPVRERRRHAWWRRLLGLTDRP